MITVYTRPTCAPCKTLKKYLDYKGVSFTEKPAEGSEYESYAKSYGVNVPLIIQGDKVLSGFNPTVLSRELGI